MIDNDDVCFRIPGTTEGIALHSIPPGQTYNVARSGDCDGPGDTPPRVTLTRRADDWHACVTGRPGLWESGRSFNAAIGALAVSLGIVRVDE